MTWKVMSRRFKNSIFCLVAMVTTQGLLFAKHGNERNYKTKHRMFTILGQWVYEYSATKTTSRIFDTVAMATGNRSIRKPCNIIQIWK